MNGAHFRRRQRRDTEFPNLLDRTWWIELSRTAGARLVGVVLGAFVVGYLLTAVVFFPGGGAGVVTVPDLRGMTEEEAREVLERHDLEFEAGTALVHPEAPEGEVLAQSPLPGEEVAPGSGIQVHLSAGRARQSVPDVRNLTAERAEMILRRNGFQVVFDSVRDTIRAGSVVDVQPAVGTTVEVPAEIRVVISSGPPKVPVPDVVALPPTVAASVLDEAGLHLGSVDYDPFSDAPLGEVVEQQPAAGDSLAMGSEVSVVVSGSHPLPEIIRPFRDDERRGRRPNVIIRDVPGGT